MLSFPIQILSTLILKSKCNNLNVKIADINDNFENQQNLRVVLAAKKEGNNRSSRFLAKKDANNTFTVTSSVNSSNSKVNGKSERMTMENQKKLANDVKNHQKKIQKKIDDDLKKAFKGDFFDKNFFGSNSFDEFEDTLLDTNNFDNDKLLQGSEVYPTISRFSSMSSSDSAEYSESGINFEQMVAKLKQFGSKTGINNIKLVYMSEEEFQKKDLDKIIEKL